MRLVSSSHRRGFTVPELLVSIMIIGLIALAVVGDLNRTKYSEQLQSSARSVAGTLRNLQARAQAAASIKICTGSSVQEVCEVSLARCVGSCNTAIPPFAVGMTFAQNATSVGMFAEVDGAQNNRRAHVSESLGTLNFLEGRAGEGYVTIASLTTNQGSVTSTTITFERQSGAMRIDGCDTPTPYTPACSMSGEPVSLTIVLQHARTGLTRTIRLNAATGKISLE